MGVLDGIVSGVVLPAELRVEVAIKGAYRITDDPGPLPDSDTSVTLHGSLEGNAGPFWYSRDLIRCCDRGGEPRPWEQNSYRGPFFLAPR